MAHVQTMEYYSATKQNEMIPLRASWIQLEITILSEVNQKEKGKYYVTLFTPGILKKKKIQMDLFTKQKQTHRLRE